MPKSEAERIARLEAQQEEGERVHEALFQQVREQQATLKSMDERLGKIDQKLSRYQGFASGAWFAVTALGGVIGGLVTAFWKKFLG